jgi:hypothetical protein
MIYYIIHIYYLMKEVPSVMLDHAWQPNANEKGHSGKKGHLEDDLFRLFHCEPKVNNAAKLSDQ